MFNINEYVVYKREVCKVSNIKNINNKEYYVLVPVNDESLTIDVPSNGVTNIKKIISKDEVLDIIKRIPEIETIKCNNDKYLEYEYKRLLNEMSHEGLIKIIKTTYLRNKERVDNKRKIGEKDDTYFKKAEKLLYTEFSLALGKSYEETKEFVISNVEKYIENK